MSAGVQTVILGCEMLLGYILGRVFIPYFRRIKTGKFDFYIGDRFAKDGSEPKFGGAVIMLCVVFGIVTGVIFYDSRTVMSLGSGAFSKRVFVVLGGAAMLTAIGLSEDYVKEKKLGIGMKPFYKAAMEYLICFGVCVALRYCGGLQTAVLLPFHWGYIQFGKLFYVLFPLFMTVGINIVKIHDCAGGKTDTGVDGLCAVTALIFSAGLSFGIVAKGGCDEALLVAVCTMGAASGFLFWGCSPAKLYLGESGALALGGLMTAAVLLSGEYFVFLLAGAAAVVDGVSAFLQYFVFKTRKKLLMKGYTLHGHLKNKGHGDLAVIGIFAVISVAGAAAAAAFLIYSGKITL